ncbi:MAG: STAS domain-containing protein [Clostridia bacterium]|nr:STAS domain-containing protein [Clostridia bacterium]
MNINKTIEGKNIIINVVGRLDTNTSPVLESDIADIENYENVTFDFEKLDYISSAGLRVLLSAQKRMNKINGTLEIKNCNETVKDVFDITGFCDILTIK